jgi:hypothetical protein
MANNTSDPNIGKNAALIAALDEPYVEYWKALGQFISEFARTEKTLQFLLRHYAEVSENVGKAIFHGTRIDAAKDHINRILEATDNLEAKNRLERPFAQLGVISGMRNNIVHWGSTRKGPDDFLVSNSSLAHTKERLREFQISPRALRAMSLDLFAISVHFVMEMRRAGEPEIVEEFSEIVNAPWLYKPPQPTPQTKGTRARRRERKNPLDALQQ